MRGAPGHGWWGTGGRAPSRLQVLPPLPSHHVHIESPLPVLGCFHFVSVVLFSLRLQIIKIIADWLYFQIPVS